MDKLEEIEQLNKKLLEKTNIYAEFEDRFRKNILLIDFKLEVETGIFFIWKKDPKSTRKKHCRLFIYNPTISLSPVPMRQTRFPVRLRYVKYMGLFIEKFTEHLTALNNT